jgi:hypothetical protein
MVEQAAGHGRSSSGALDRSRGYGTFALAVGVRRLGSAQHHDIAALASATAELLARCRPIMSSRSARRPSCTTSPRSRSPTPASRSPHRSIRTSGNSFIHRHTLIGERNIAAATDLREVAILVRSTHEHYRVPAQRWSSAIAALWPIAGRQGRSLVVALYASQTAMIPAPSGIWSAVSASANTVPS